jgi:predicted small lipoprotein YifL
VERGFRHKTNKLKSFRYRCRDLLCMRLGMRPGGIGRVGPFGEVPGESAVLSRFRHRSLLRLATIAALAASFALVGCGRKGGLDPPPSAWVSPPPQAEPTLGEVNDPNAPGFRRAPRQTAVAPAPTSGPDQRTFILDPLIK